MMTNKDTLTIDSKPLNDNVFLFNGKEIRTVTINNDVWFCGKDVACILEYSNTERAIRVHIREKHKVKLQDIGPTSLVGLSYNELNSIYITEPGLYSLVMKSKMSKAIEFQDWIYEEVIPSIRQNGYYVSNDIKENQIKQLQEELKQNQLELKEERESKNRLYNINKELLSYKKMITKDETIYIVSTHNYARQGIFKVGRTRTKMVLRNSCHNSTHIAGDKVKVLKEFKVNNSKLVENVIHSKLRGLLVNGEKEFFMCPYEHLKTIIDAIVINDEEHNNLVNSIIDVVYKLKQKAFNCIDWMTGIAPNVFKETLLITEGEESKLAELDITNWSDGDKQVFIQKCIQVYKEQKNLVDAKRIIIEWKPFQDYIIECLSIPKTKFKSKDWKQVMKKEEEQDEQLSITWRRLQ